MSRPYCAGCGKDLVAALTTVSTSQGVFCAWGCHDVSVKAPDPPGSECASCGGGGVESGFSPRHGEPRFCGDACRNHYWGKHPERPMVSADIDAMNERLDSIDKSNTTLVRRVRELERAPGILETRVNALDVSNATIVRAIRDLEGNLGRTAADADLRVVEEKIARVDQVVKGSTFVTSDPEAREKIDHMLDAFRGLARKVDSLKPSNIRTCEVKETDRLAQALRDAYLGLEAHDARIAALEELVGPKTWPLRSKDQGEWNSATDQELGALRGRLTKLEKETVEIWALAARITENQLLRKKPHPEVRQESERNPARGTRSLAGCSDWDSYYGIVLGLCAGALAVATFGGVVLACYEKLL